MDYYYYTDSDFESDCENEVIEKQEEDNIDFILDCYYNLCDRYHPLFNCKVTEFYELVSFTDGKRDLSSDSKEFDLFYKSNILEIEQILEEIKPLMKKEIDMMSFASFLFNSQNFFHS